jgi:hypothetical protein
LPLYQNNITYKVTSFKISSTVSNFPIKSLVKSSRDTSVGDWPGVGVTATVGCPTEVAIVAVGVSWGDTDNGVVAAEVVAPLVVDVADVDLVGFTLMPSFSAQQMAYKCDTSPSRRMIFDRRGVSGEEKAKS